MATKRKSIIEEALLEAKSLEDALKANTKEMLASHMKQEIENIVETSLKKEGVNNEGSDVKNERPVNEQEEIEIGDEEDLVAVLAGNDSEEVSDEDIDIDVDALDAEEESELDLDLDIDLDDAEDEVEADIDVAELPIDLELGDEEELDLTGSPDDEVLKVFKAMGDEDEVEVVKDEDGIYLADNETGAEYYIRESERLDEDGLCEDCDNEEVQYEIELDEHQGTYDTEDESLGMRLGKGSGTKTGRDLSYGDWGKRKKDWKNVSEDEDLYEYEEGSDSETYPGDEDFTTKKSSRDYHRGGKDVRPTPFGEGEDLEEDHTLARTKGYQRKGGHRNRQAESRKSRRPISNKRKEPRNVRKVNDSKIMIEYKELKSKNEQYKGALKVFKDKLNEVALFNTNLAYVNRLFTEHSTTKKEKMGILKRFDGASGIKESKSIYKSIKEELDVKSPITESVDNKVNRTVKSSASDLNESTAYVDPQIVAIKDLMKRIS